MTYPEFKIKIAEIHKMLKRYHAVEAGHADYKPVDVDGFWVRKHYVRPHVRHIVVMRRRKPATK